MLPPLVETRVSMGWRRHEHAEGDCHKREIRIRRFPRSSSSPRKMIAKYLVAAALSSAVALTVGDAAKVMSFNVRTSVAKDPCPAGCWDERKVRVEKLLQRHEPDFIGTQETAPDQVEFIASLGYAWTGECAGNCQWDERNAIFYNASQWLMVDGYTFALSDTPDIVPSNTWNLEFIRAAVLARFTNKQTADTVCMLNTHYDITRGQNQSSVLVANRIASFCQPGDTVVMTGDLNTLPESAPVRYLEGKLSINDSTTPIPMYETLTAAGAGGPTWVGNAFNATLTGGKIDYIFARRDAHTCLQRGDVLLDAFDGYTSSDHAVVMSTFCLGGSCADCVA